jgi:low affinity Fe/Cu permease
MSRPAIEPQPPTVHDHFGRFAASASAWLGSTWAFMAAGLVIVVWACTALMTFLMVFLIQNMQNRDARAINLKLNELIRAADNARNQMIDIERLTDLELDQLQSNYERIKAAWTERQLPKSRGTTEE